MQSGTRKSFKGNFQVGDHVWITYLIKGGPPEKAEWGMKEGTIEKIKPAGDLGARAMDCAPDDLIHWVSDGDCLYPRFACELSRIPQLPEDWWDENVE